MQEKRSRLGMTGGIHPDTPLTDFPRVGPATAAKLERLGLRCAGDLLVYYPRDYEDRRTIWPIQSAPAGEKVCVRGMIARPPQFSYLRRGLSILKLQVVDESGRLYVSLFNQNHLRNAIHAGEEYFFYGTLDLRDNLRTMSAPALERVGEQEAMGRIAPVYPLTAGLTNARVSELARRAVEGCAAEQADDLPEETRRRFGLCERGFALSNVHFPDSFESLARAKARLSFEELFYLSLGLARLGERRGREGDGQRLDPPPAERFQAALPFPLTGAQTRAMEEIRGDLASGRCMNRLLQGDVGSGKTMVAAYAIYAVARGGLQSALMVPTEVLAEQHFKNLSALFAPLGIETVLLTASQGARQRRDARERLALGAAALAVGTHALLSEGVEFAALGLVVTDEQHRFGVRQRSALAGKSGGEPHVLVMSATPIPRTLALVIYGDLDVSVLNELPPGRTPVETYAVGEDKRARLYAFVRRLVREGRQVYIVCPAVEETGGAGPEMKSAAAYARQLQETVFPELRVGLLHGKLRPKEKERVMAAFAAGEIDVLVATTVIEVGVDVPNAALMIVENAERFGLSQLHQLRGRVGRGRHRSYCVLVSSARGETARQRLRTLARTTDGFQIAEEDLKLRGPGDFFGSRQHGLPTLHTQGMLGDTRILDQAQQAARELLTRDPELSAHPRVRERVNRMFQETADTFN